MLSTEVLQKDDSGAFYDVIGLRIRAQLQQALASAGFGEVARARLLEAFHFRWEPTCWDYLEYEWIGRWAGVDGSRPGWLDFSYRWDRWSGSLKVTVYEACCAGVVAGPNAGGIKERSGSEDGSATGTGTTVGVVPAQRGLARPLELYHKTVRELFRCEPRVTIGPRLLRVDMSETLARPSSSEVLLRRFFYRGSRRLLRFSVSSVFEEPNVIGGKVVFGSGPWPAVEKENPPSSGGETQTWSSVFYQKWSRDFRHGGTT